MSSKRCTGVRIAWYVSLLVIVVGTLWVPFYNRIEPRFFGIPFFYWFQFCWIIVTAVVTGAAYKAKI